MACGRLPGPGLGVMLLVVGMAAGPPAPVRAGTSSTLADDAPPRAAPEPMAVEPATGVLPPAALRGKEIYTRGVSSSGAEVTALMGEAAVEVPATVLPCVSCHGERGHGRPEGGVTPTNITWNALTKPYGVRHADGRRHPPYDERLLKRAIAMGVDPAGNALHLAMPRYRLTHADMEDLVAYIRLLEEGLDPGLSRTGIRIGTLVPGSGPFAARGTAMEAALRAYFDELNDLGGIYNRRIELVVGDTGAEPQAAAEAARAFLDQERPFALAGVFLAGAETELASLAAEAEVPLVAALAVNPRPDFLVNRHVFYLDPGLEGQARALIEFMARRPDGPRGGLAVLYRKGTLLANVVEAVVDQAGARGWPGIDQVPLEAAGFDPEGLVRRLRGAGVETLFLLASGRPERAILEEAARLDWGPDVLLPGSLADAGIFALPESAGRRVLLAFPTLPSDQSPAGRLEYRKLAADGGLSLEYPAAQIAALCSAKILVEGLKRAGSDLSREGLLEALDDLREFDTDLMPQVTYGPNRRIGANGAHIVSLDTAERTFVPVGSWIDLE